jgi:hypothetical protein
MDWAEMPSFRRWEFPVFSDIALFIEFTLVIEEKLDYNGDRVYSGELQNNGALVFALLKQYGNLEKCRVELLATAKYVFEESFSVLR